MKRMLFLVLAASAGATAVASAEPLSYSYLDLAYTRETASGVDFGTGGQAPVSYGLGDRFFLDAQDSYETYGGQTYNGRPLFSVRNYQLGGGMHLVLSDSADLVGRLNVARTAPGSANSFASHYYYYLNNIEAKTGYDLAIGVRDQPAPAWELDGFLEHTSVGYDYRGQVSFFFPAIVSENTLSLGLHWHFTPRFDAGLTARRANLNGKSEMLLSGRWYF